MAWVELRVGDDTFRTTRTTLEPFMYFKALLSEPADVYRVDRDGTHFRVLLNAMRGSIVLPATARELRELRVEADFYGLARVVDAVDVALSKKRGGDDVAAALDAICTSLNRPR